MLGPSESAQPEKERRSSSVLESAGELHPEPPYGIVTSSDASSDPPSRSGVARIFTNDSALTQDSNSESDHSSDSTLPVAGDCRQQ